MTRIAMIGAGGVAQRHVEVLSGLDDVQVVSVTDISQEAASALADTVGAAAHTDLAAGLDGVDAAYVCVPPFAHGEPENAVLDRGLPLFVEKPVGLDLVTAKGIAARVEETGVVTGAGYHWRCLDTVDRLAELLQGTTPALAQGWWWGGRPPVDWWNRRDRSGGQVVEQLAHVIDLARLLLGDAVQVHAGGVRLPDVAGDSDVDDAGAAFLRFESGAVATFSTTCALTKKHSAGLSVMAPQLHAAIAEEDLVVDRGDGEPQRWEPRRDPRVVVDEEFVAAVRGERDTVRSPYADALASHQLAWAIAESSRTGRTFERDEKGDWS